MLLLVVFFREGKVPWGKSDLGIWLRLLISEEKSGNKLSSPPSPQYTMGQSAARILLINPLAPTSYGAFIFVWWFWRLSYLREVISKHVDFEAALSPRARRMDGVREYEDEAQEVAASSSPQSLLYHCITMLQPLHTDDPRSQNYAGKFWLTLFGSWHIFDTMKDNDFCGIWNQESRQNIKRISFLAP